MWFLRRLLEGPVIHVSSIIALLLLLLRGFRRGWLCVTPWMAAHQAPPSLGFSRQEHWSGMPFTSPMHESRKWNWSCSLSRVRLLATPLTAAYQAPPSMGFSRQEYWSGVPLPSLYNSTRWGNWKVRVLVTQSCLTLWPNGTHEAPLSMEFSRQEYWSELSFPMPEELPDPGIEPTSPILHAESLSSEPPGKPHRCSLSNVCPQKTLIGPARHVVLRNDLQSWVLWLAWFFD